MNILKSVLLMLNNENSVLSSLNLLLILSDSYILIEGEEKQRLGSP